MQVEDGHPILKLGTLSDHHLLQCIKGCFSEPHGIRHHQHGRFIEIFNGLHSSPQARRGCSILITGNDGCVGSAVSTNGHDVAFPATVIKKSTKTIVEVEIRTYRNGIHRIIVGRIHPYQKIICIEGVCTAIIRFEFKQ